MSNIKSLAGQTVWYGISSIAARFINYLLTPYLTYSTLITTADYGMMTSVYAAIPLFNILFTYGMETTYFRFIQRKEVKDQVNNTATISLLVSSILFTGVLWLLKDKLAAIMTLENAPELVKLSIFIIGLDALSTIPFARLRNENRPRLFAFIKIAGILVNIGFTVFFLSYCPAKAKADANSWAAAMYNPDANPITYVLWANIMQAFFTLLLLSKWIFPKQWKFDAAVFKQIMTYSLPMLVAGLGGMVNETFDRLMLGWWLPGSENYAHEQTGIYGACYKLSILITLFIQAFRMGAEPFFFKQAEQTNPQAVYARVTKFFTITVTFMFLVVTLFLPVWKYFIDERYWPGLGVVPILLLANISLGIYYNLSVWYKVTNRTMAGAWITLIGTTITFAVNWFFIPKYSYYACAWATLLCYASMMIISFVWGQKEYRIPYEWKKLLMYIVGVVALFFIQKGIALLTENQIAIWSSGVALLLLYALFIVRMERKELQAIPVVGRYIK